MSPTTYEAQKEKLIQSAEDLKRTLNIEIDQMKENATALGKVALVAGGTVFLTYKVIQAFRKRKAKKRQKVKNAYHPVPIKQTNLFARKILEQIGFFVLAVVRQKLLETLENKQRHGK